MTDTSTPIKRTDPREVCSKEFFERITNRLLNEHPTFERALAERITEQGLAYLYTAARTGELLSPSPMVDLAWHAMILHTRDYADWCDEFAGHVVHHIPEDAAVDRSEAAAASPVRSQRSPFKGSRSTRSCGLTLAEYLIHAGGSG
ncbi:hypothetical protein [Streptomyces sp. NPDC004685]